MTVYHLTGIQEWPGGAGRWAYVPRPRPEARLGQGPLPHSLSWSLGAHGSFPRGPRHRLLKCPHGTAATSPRARDLGEGERRVLREAKTEAAGPGSGLCDTRSRPCTPVVRSWASSFRLPAPHLSPGLPGKGLPRAKPPRGHSLLAFSVNQDASSQSFTPPPRASCSDLLQAPRDPVAPNPRGRPVWMRRPAVSPGPVAPGPAHRLWASVQAWGRWDRPIQSPSPGDRRLRELCFPGGAGAGPARPLSCV